MLSSTDQAEIARRFGDAVFGYAVAAINATFEANARALAAAAELSNAFHHPEPVHEWSGAPRRPRTALRDEPKSAAAWPNPFDMAAAVFGLKTATPGPMPWFFSAAPSPFAWWSWLPQSAVPQTWPFAYQLISSGVPGSVAWPMAEANVALIDAASRTAEAVKLPFPAYRSDNGFATAQVFTQPILNPLAAGQSASVFVWPWFKTAA